MKHPFRLTHAFFPTACVLVACGDFDHANIITIAFAGVVNAEPPMIGVSMRKQAHSYALMNRFGEFTVNIPHDRMLREVDVCGTVSGGDTDKFDYTGLTKKASVKVKPPLIEEAIVNLECLLRHTLELGSHTLFIGEVVQVHMDERVTDARGRVTLNKAKPIVYCPVVHEYRALGKKLGTYGFSEGKRED